MLEKCLFTKVKGECLNDSLPVFGALDIDMSVQTAVKSITAMGGKYKLLSGSLYTSSALTTEIPNEGDLTNSPFYCASSNTAILRLEKYKLTSLAMGSSVDTKFNFNDLDFSPITNFSMPSSGTVRNNVVGTFEKFVENQCTFRAIGDTITVQWSYTAITLHGSLHKSAYLPTIVTITATGATLSSSSFGTIATYNKATGAWTYSAGV